MRQKTKAKVEHQTEMAKKEGEKIVLNANMEAYDVKNLENREKSAEKTKKVICRHCHGKWCSFADVETGRNWTRRRKMARSKLLR